MRSCWRGLRGRWSETAEWKISAVIFVCNWSVNPDEISEEFEPSDSVRVRAVQVKCTSRVDPVVVMEAFLEGHDGVLLLGCEPGNCHFIEGNLQAQERVRTMKMLMELAGLQPERLEIRWCSTVNEGQHTETVREFSETISEMGPSPLSGENVDPELRENMLSARGVLEDYRIRAVAGKALELTEKGNVYGERVSRDEFGEFEGEAVETEYLRHRIRRLLRTPMTVPELSEKLGLDTRSVFRQVVALSEKGVVHLDHFEGKLPLYVAEEAQP
jgi:F420-non-reducing hydrogenase iron-sulfur subunit